MIPKMKKQLKIVLKALEEDDYAPWRWRIADEYPHIFSIGSVESSIRTYGYDKAKDMGFLDIYKAVVYYRDFSFWKPYTDYLLVDPR